MKEQLLDILACPYDKHHPLVLYRGIIVNDTVETGILHCTECNRPYIISEGIPIMLPDDLRDKESEKAVAESVPDTPKQILEWFIS